MEKVNIRGIPFDNVTKEEAKSLILERLASGERTTVVTPNAEIVGACIDDPALLPLVTEADVILPDGVGVVKAAKILETPLKERVPGVEIGEEIVKSLAGTEHSVFILGGKEGVAESAARRLAGTHGAKISGYHHGYFVKEDGSSDIVIEEINGSGADVLYVCLGFPIQEAWIAENKSALPRVKLIMALGGSVDVWAGKVRRAPKIFRKLGLEWFWRLLRQPSRIGRVMKLPKFYLGMKRYKKKIKKDSSKKF